MESNNEIVAAAKLKLIACLLPGFFLLWDPLPAQPPTHTNSIGMEFVLVKPGKFVVGKFSPPYPVPDDTIKNAKRPLVMWMGDGRSYSADEFRLARELALKDSREGFIATIDQPYYMGKFEVTQQQWEKVMGGNPSTFTARWVKEPDRHPVETITWDEAQEFVRRLNALENSNRYRLPTEFEWEYAARAGAPGDIAWSEVQKMAHLGKKTTEAVGLKEPNAWGLYDMLGNVWEWVADYYNGRLFADPKPPVRGEHHVLKGASIAGDVKNATYMTHAGGPGNGWDVGFRIVMMVTGQYEK